MAGQDEQWTTIYAPPQGAAPAAAPPATPPAGETWTTLNPPAAPDQYQQAAQDELAQLDKTNSAPATGYGARARRGALMGLTDELRAGISTPLEMYRHGTANPIEGYRYAKAVEDALTARMMKQTEGPLGTLAELGGGLTTGAGAFGGAARPVVTATTQALPKVLKTGATMGAIGGAGYSPTITDYTDPSQYGRLALDTGKGAALGAIFSGAMAIPRAQGSAPFLGTSAQTPELLRNMGRSALRGGTIAGGYNAIENSDKLSDVPGNFAIGALGGAAVGGALPLAGPAGRVVGNVLQTPRFRNPETMADRAMSEVVRRAGMTPNDVVTEMANAESLGVPGYTIADALGNAGQRKLAPLAKTPGVQRELITDQLEGRNLDIAPNVHAKLSEAFGVDPVQTPDAVQEALRLQGLSQAQPHYDAAMQTPTWSPRIQQFIEDPIVRKGLLHGIELQRLEALATGKPFDPFDLRVVGYDNNGLPIINGVPNMRTLQTAKIGLDRLEEGARGPNNVATSESRAIGGVRKAFLDELNKQNPAYAEANRLYGGPMRVRQAIDLGADMPSTGLAADNIARFNALPPAEQQGVRAGYIGNVRQKLESGSNYPAVLQRKSQKGVAELNALAQPGYELPLREYLNRIETMKKTSNKALGGSSTFENIADAADASNAMHALRTASSAITGNVPGAVRNAAWWLHSAGQGQNEAQRMAIAKLLMGNTPQEAQAFANRINAHNARYNAPPPNVPWSQFFRP